MTIITYFVRQQLYNPKDGWQNISFTLTDMAIQRKLLKLQGSGLCVWVMGPIGPTGLEQENCIHGKERPLMSIVV